MIEMQALLKRLAAKLPARWQQELKRLYFDRQIRFGRFRTDEREYLLLDGLVQPGDWVLDIGANIGHYTARLSELVGERGRVIAFEPVPQTFELLAANVARLRWRNVTLLNLAASHETALAGMTIPKFASGLDNYYMARLTAKDASFRVLSTAVDALNLPSAVRLVKIDAEGHELSVLRGMIRLLSRDRPVLIVEESSADIVPFLRDYGYAAERLEGSSNLIFRALGSKA